jgi:hypothetical protein
MQFSAFLRELRNIENANPIPSQANEFNQLTPGSSLRLVLTDFTQKRARKSRKQRRLRSDRKSTPPQVNGSLLSG